MSSNEITHAILYVSKLYSDCIDTVSKMKGPSNIWINFKRYLANCNIHGIRYIVEDGIHWTERLFWFITCALCWFGWVTMVRDSLKAFQHQAVAITAETTYLEWQIDFPSVSICMRTHPEAVRNAAAMYKKQFGIDISSAPDWGWLFSGITKRYTPATAEKFSKLTAKNVAEIYEQSTLKCSQLISDCFWRSVKFNCCEEFVPLRTGAGICYMFNSRHTKNDETSNKFIMNQNTGVGYLSIGFTSLVYARGIQISASIQNDLTIPMANSNEGKDIEIAMNRMSIVYFTLGNVFNEDGLKYVSPRKRKCRFPDENENLNVYKRYSYTGCRIQLLMEKMMKACGCVSHLYPYGPMYPACNFTSILCLNKNNLGKIEETDSSNQCLPDCEDTVIKDFQHVETRSYDESPFKISQGMHLQLLELPTSRFKRYIVRSLLDLVVAVGSTAGLFMGAGILSLVEIPYWLLFRHGS